MINFVTKENIKEQNPVWPQVPEVLDLEKQIHCLIMK